MMAFVLLIGMAQCKKEQVTPSENNGVNITLKVDGGSEKLNVFPATGAVIFTAGDQIYVGNNGKYVGTLTFENGLFQGTISGDLSTEDYLHFYFVGNKPTSPTALSAGTTTYTVDISDQTAYLPAISYAPSKEKYSSNTAAYTARLLNKSALVKFVTSLPTDQPITVSGMKNEVQIDFANHTLTPTGTTGGITLYSVSDTEKWAILLEQEAVPNATVTILGYAATTSVPAITNNMYYNSGVGISMTATSVVFHATSSDWSSVVSAFNAEPTENPILVLETDIDTRVTITRADGEIDFNGHTINSMYIQNNILGKAVTLRDGTIGSGGLDGNGGLSDFYKGTVILENMNINHRIWTDGHAYIINGGIINEIEHTKNASTPGTCVINNGKFGTISLNTSDGSTFTLYGGKYKNSYSSWCAPGYSVKSNTDPDNGTYPYIVSAD